MKVFSYTTNHCVFHQYKVIADDFNHAVDIIRKKYNFKKLEKSNSLPIEIWEGEKTRSSFTFDELSQITKIYK